MKWKRLRKSLKSRQDTDLYNERAECLLELQILENQGYIDLFYGDESGFSLNPSIPYGWQYPQEQVCICPKYSPRLNILGFLSANTSLEAPLATFCYEKSINSQFVVDSIEIWLAKRTKMTVLVLDNASIHSSKLFKAKIEEWQEKGLYIFCLPKYSPHLNKIETLWRKTKYEWLKADNYKDFPTLREAVKQIFQDYGQIYDIKFKNCNV